MRTFKMPSSKKEATIFVATLEQEWDIVASTTNKIQRSRLKLSLYRIVLEILDSLRKQAAVKYDADTKDIIRIVESWLKSKRMPLNN